MANVVYTGFDPAFQTGLDKLIARAKAEGYSPELISGTRSAYGWPGMKGQSQADLYSQLGKPGGPRAAAAPGYSPHQYGVAGDVTGIPQSELERLSQQVGLRAIHSDPNHVELANWRQEAAAQPAGTPWDQTNPANVPSKMAMNMEADAPSQPSRPISATPGLTLNSPMDLVANLESGNRNIPQAIHDRNTDKGTPAGGYFQIIDPTWQRYAAAAGVDLNQYPTAMSADRATQAKVASAIPINQWGPNTVNALKAKYPGLDTSQPLGALQSQALGGQGTAAASAATPQNAGDWVKKFVDRPPPTKDAQGNVVQGKSPLESLANAIPGKPAGQQAAAPEPAAFAPVQDPTAQMAGPAGQLFTQVLAASAKPLTWSSRPYGWDAGQQMVPGMTLNSMGRG